MKRILIVDDDVHIGNMLEEALAREGYSVSRAYSGTEAVMSVKLSKPDHVLLDLMLPGLSGEEVLPKLRGIPVIVMSAKASVDSKVELLLGGAADYVTKPFNMQILLRRIEVALRRMGAKQPAAQADRWSDGWLTLDFTALTAQRGAEKLAITPNEYKLLKTLTEHSGQILTRQVLLDRLWDSAGNFIDDHTLTVTMNRLRSKIEDEQHSYIKTVRGMGYIWTGGKP